MDRDNEIHSLAAESIAFHAVLTNLLYELRTIEPKMAAAIARGFDNAANFIETLAISAGSSNPPEHLARAVRIFEDLRATSLAVRRARRRGTASRPTLPGARSHGRDRSAGRAGSASAVEVPPVPIEPEMSSRPLARAAIIARAESFTDDGGWPSAQLIVPSIEALVAGVFDHVHKVI
jgi:hypothetical protein